MMSGRDEGLPEGREAGRMSAQFDLTRGALRAMGEWQWIPVRLHRGGTTECVSQQLCWWKEGRGRADVMRRTIPHTLDSITEEDLHEFARTPDSREFDVDGERWVAFHRRGDTFLLRRNAPAPVRVVRLQVTEAGGKELGEFGLDELQALVRAHR